MASDWNWDALSDSLFGGLHSLKEEGILLVWANSDVMARATPADFRLAERVLDDVAQLLGDPKATAGRPKPVSIVLT